MVSQAALILTLTFLLWAGLHSLTAMQPFKQKMAQMLGPVAYAGLYRLLYNGWAVLTFLPVLWALATQLPAETIWQIPRPVNLLFLVIQLIGLVGLTISLWQTDFWSFVGLRQAIRYLQGDTRPERPVPFINNGTYGLVRHPLYFFSLLIIWFAPLMPLSSFIFNLLATLYFWLGSLHEERRLLADYGDDYRRYCQEVPAFVPLSRAILRNRSTRSQ